MFELSESVWSSAVVLLFVMDPMGNIPLFLSLLKDIPPARRRRIVIRELVIALGILLIFLYFGQNLLDFLHLRQESVTIAGGIVLLIIGMRMVFPSQDGVLGNQPHGEPFIVPLAIPLIAGPSALATLILMVRSNPDEMTNWLFALLLAWGATAVMLLSAPLLYRILRDRGLIAMERLTGMLLIMIAVQMLINGIETLLI